MQAGVGAERVPQHDLRVVNDETGAQKVELSVKLPGVSCASDISLSCGQHSILLKVPGKFTLELYPPLPISDRAETVKFIKKKETLKAKFTVLPSAAEGNISTTAVNSSAAATAAAAQATQQQQQAEAQRRSDEANQQQQQQDRRAAQLAYEEAQRREQERQHNRDAAEQWLLRGLDALEQGHHELAQRAFLKAADLHPDLTTEQQKKDYVRLALVQRWQQQQQQPQHSASVPTAAAQNGGGSSSSTQRPQQQQQQNGWSQYTGSSSQEQQQQQRPGGGSNSSAKARQQQQNGNSSSTQGRTRSGSQQQQQQQHQQQQHRARGGSSSSSSRGTGPQPRGPAAASAAGGGGGGSRSTAADEDTQSWQQQEQQEQQWQQQQEQQEYPGVVGWWCKQYERVSEWVAETAESITHWSKEPGRSRFAYWCAQLLAVGILLAHFVIMFSWRSGWTAPLLAAARIRRIGGDSYVESRVWLSSTMLHCTQHTLAAAAARLLLFGLSSAAAAAAGALLLLVPLWGSSVVGWCWRAVRAVWTGLVWKPWHSLQLSLAVGAGLLLGVGELGGSIALWSLQMLLLGGGWVNLVAWLGSWLLYLGVIPALPAANWPAAASTALVIMTCVSKSAAWWGAATFSPLINPNSTPTSWWWWCVLVVLYLLVILIKADPPPGYEHDNSSSSRWGRADGSSSSSRHEDDAYYDDSSSSSDMAYTKYVMGFGAVAVPDGCEVVEVKEVLMAKTYYQVMGFASREACSPDSLKAARKAKALAVHPDKAGSDPGAHQAAQRVNKAYEILSDPQSRKTYDRLLDLHAQPRGSSSSNRPSSRSGSRGSEPVYIPPYTDDLYDIESSPACMCDMSCPNCGLAHTVYMLPRAPFGVRWCRECRSWHPTKAAQHGEVWAHWSPGWRGIHMLGRCRVLFAPAPDAPVFDISDLFNCGGRLMNDCSMCNTHRNPIGEAMTGRGSRRGGGGAHYSSSGAGGGGSSCSSRGGVRGGGGGSHRSNKKKGRRR